MGWVQQQVPVQLIRLGRIRLAVMPGEVTAAVGVMDRRAVAEVALGPVPRDEPATALGRQPSRELRVV